MNRIFFNIIMVGIGSMAGGIGRYIISKVLKEFTSINFPFGTFVVNVIGCLILGILYGLIDRGWHLSEGWRLLLTVGFCGGFTTFSTFINENYLLFSTSQILLSVIYMFISIAGGFLFLYGGYYLSRC